MAERYIIMHFMIMLTAVPLWGQSGKTDSLLSRIAGMEEDTLKVNALEVLAEQYEKVDYDRAFEVLEEMESLSRRLDYTRGLARSAYLQGRLFLLLEKPDSSIKHYRSYLRMQPRPSPLNEAKVYNSFGLAHYYKQNFDSSLYYFDQSIRLYRKTQAGADICGVVNNMGLTAYQMGNLQRSLNYFQQAYECLIKHNKRENLSRVINNLASVSAHLGRNNADSLFFAVLERHGNDMAPFDKASVYYNIGSMYFHKEDYESAKRFVKIADSLYRSAGVENNPEVAHLLGNIASNNHNYEKALRYYRSILYDESGPRDMALLYKNMAQTFHAAGQHDSSQYYYEKLIRYRDSLASSQIDKALEKAQRNLELYKKESRIKQLELERDLLRSSEEKTLIVAISLGAGLVLLTLLVILYRRKEKERRKAKNAALKRKQERLADLSLQIARKNEVIDRVEGQLQRYDQKKQIQEELKTDIIKSLNIQDDWDTFARFFEDQHKGFYDRLKDKAPDLTDQELRVCSLSGMRLSLKETASILHVSVDAVKSARYRIRKKLDLSSDEKLSDFLNELGEK